MPSVFPEIHNGFYSSEGSHRYYAERHDDRYYDGPEEERVSDVFGKTVCKISAVTEYDYNPNYPAGSSLDDIMKVHVRTFAPFIDDKCRNASDERVFGQYISKRLCDLTPEEGRLWDPYTLTLSIGSENPTTSIERLQVTVTILFDDGQEISATHTMNDYHWH